MKRLRVIQCLDLPPNPDPNAAYRLLPVSSDDAYYWERVDRNIGWITRGEQEMLRRSTVGVAGCGGMGGFLHAILLRLGIGELRLTDVESFDASNLNRQFGSRRKTIGKSKAFATVRMVRDISNDCTITVYPQGICEETVNHFLSGCDIVCDEIEFWAVGARILLHAKAREKNVPVLNCNTIGFGTRCFLFTPKSATMEECLGMSFEEARELQEKIQTKRATDEERKRVMDAVITGLLPQLPNYCTGGAFDNRKELYRRTWDEGKIPIIATNPPMATGFLADQVLLYLLRKFSEIKRVAAVVPPMPGYLYFDAAKMKTEIIREKWWQQDA